MIRSRLAAAAAFLLLGAGAHAEPPQKTPPVVTRLPPLPPAVIDDALTIAGEDIEGRKVRSRMTVPVQVNGHGPFGFVVDSGADTSVIGERVARQLQLPAGTPVMLHGITASAPVDRVRVDTLRIGGSDFYDMHLPVLKERDLGGAGMLGIDALVEQRLMLDFEKRTIKIEDAKQRAQRLDGEIVVVARRHRGQLILTQARVNGRPIEAVIDTGSEITIGNRVLRDQIAARYADAFTTIAVTGVTGVTTNLQLIRVGELRLGSVVLRNVPIAFAEVPPFAVFGLSTQPALLLGTDLMETFRRVSLDFRARKVRFQLRRCSAQGITITTNAPGDWTRLSMANGTTAACAR